MAVSALISENSRIDYFRERSQKMPVGYPNNMAPIMMKKPVPPTQMFPDLPVEPIQASTIIIIHPGSMFLRIGRASDTFPHTIPHVIARRHKNRNTLKYEDSLLVPVSKMSPEIEASMDEVQAAISAVLASCITDQGETRYSVSLKQVHEHNTNVCPEIIKSNSDVRWTKVDDSQDVLVGEEVLYLNPNESFDVHWPVRRGQFNIHPGIGGSLTAVMADMEVIWSTAIQKYLDIPLKDLKLYRAVLVIPDVYRREHVKELISLILTKLEFSSCFVHLESVCATFGAGLSYACVVDVGDQKTTVSCVEDGISHRSTRLCMEYGGSDVTQLFHWMQQKCGVPYEECSPRCMLDSLLLRDLKETLCHVNLNVYGPQDRSFLVKHPDKPVHRYMIQVGDECLIAPVALLHPELFALTGPKEVRTLQRSTGDPEDPHDEIYLIQTQRRGVKDITEGPSEPTMADDSHLNSSILDEDMDSTDPPSSINVRESEQDPMCIQLLGIDQAIVQSIECCDSDELKRKMYSCILVVGGGMMFHGIHTYLRNRLSVQIPISYRGEPIDIITRPKEMDPRITAWKGASVMSCLDTAQELWIRRAEWMRYSVKLLRERAPFTW